MMRLGLLSYNGVNYGIRFNDNKYTIINQNDEILTENLHSIKEVRRFCKDDSKSSKYDGKRFRFFIEHPEIEKRFSRSCTSIFTI
jgi:hypothetical protein